MTATPRPWNYIKSSVSIFSNETDDVERIKICDTSTHNKSVQEAQENAALIVKAVNTLDEAKAVLRTLLDEYGEGGMLDGQPIIKQAKAVLADMEG